MENKRYKILVIEDTESNYLLVSFILKEEYDVLWAHDGVEALQMFAEYRPDLILMDMRMPRMGGLATTMEIRKTDTKIPIIALTAFTFDTDREQAETAGCSDFIAKPLDTSELRNKIKKHLGIE